MPLACRQHDEDDLIDCHQRFVGLVHVVEMAYRNIRPKDDKNKDAVSLLPLGSWIEQIGSNMEVS